MIGAVNARRSEVSSCKSPIVVLTTVEADRAKETAVLSWIGHRSTPLSKIGNPYHAP